MRILSIIGPDGSGGATLNIPDTAIPIPPGGLIPAAQMATADAIDSQYKHLDANDLAKQKLSYSNWLATAGRFRDLAIPVSQWPPKPSQLTAHTVKMVMEISGTLWLWVETSLMGSPCPDLPPEVPIEATPGTVQIGNHNYGLYWGQGPNDNPPDDVFAGKQLQGVSLDGYSGTWMFVASPMTSEIYGRRGWYLKTQ